MTTQIVYSPLQRYQADLEQDLIQADSEQKRIVVRLDQLHEQLLAESWHTGKTKSSLWSWLRPAAKPAVGIEGIYLWGGVGRGKTYLMDLFYDCLPFPQKRRTHFHRFMQSVHQGLRRHAGEANPLSRIAQDIAAGTRILCFDEFFVADIGDAMLLARLLEALFDEGVLLMATSNIEPDKLYAGGLQRESFLPAIALIKQHCQVIEMTAGLDYRLRSLEQAVLYHHPLGEAAEQSLLASFQQLAPDLDGVVKDEQIEILGRLIQTRYCGDDVVWFDFDQLCAGPRSASDYVEIAKIYHALLMGQLPSLDAVAGDQVRRFIGLVDQLYDRNVKLVLAAAVPLAELYHGSELAFEFERTRSRLLEMQSHEYLARGHRP